MTPFPYSPSDTCSIARTQLIHVDPSHASLDTPLWDLSWKPFRLCNTVLTFSFRFPDTLEPIILQPDILRLNNSFARCQMLGRVSRCPTPQSHRLLRRS
jgi:hypothetical protein